MPLDQGRCHMASFMLPLASTTGGGVTCTPPGEGATSVCGLTTSDTGITLPTADPRIVCRPPSCTNFDGVQQARSSTDDEAVGARAHFLLGGAMDERERW